MYSIVVDRIYVNFRMILGRFQDVDLFDGYVYMNRPASSKYSRRSFYRYDLTVVAIVTNRYLWRMFFVSFDAYF